MSGVSKILFPSLVELARDDGKIAQDLQSVPNWILRAADKWAEQEADYKENHNDPNRLPTPDPWEFLLSIPGATKKGRKVFRAAQSQLWAWRHLIHMLQGVATLHTDWYLKALEAKEKNDQRAFEHAIARVASAHVLIKYVQDQVRKQENPEVVKQMEWLLTKRQTQLIRHGGGKEQARLPKRWPSWKAFERSNRLPVILVEFWVRFGVSGAPGLMYWRNEALTKFLKIHLDRSNIDPRGVKKTRQQLGLIPVSQKQHFVWDIAIRNSKKKRVILGYERNGATCFCVALSAKKYISPGVFLSPG